MQPHSPGFRYSSSISVVLACLALLYTVPSTAQTPPESTQPTTQQATPEPPPQPARRRLRATFFEEERRVHPYGAIDFLDAALDGADNSLVTNIRNEQPFLFPDGVRVTESQDGTLEINNFNTSSSDFLEGTNFSAANRASQLTISNVHPGSNPQTGTLSLQGTINGRQIDITDGKYSGSFSRNGERASGILRVTDPTDPNNTISIRVPRNQIPGIKGDNPARTPATITVGRPLDR